MSYLSIDFRENINYNKLIIFKNITYDWKIVAKLKKGMVKRDITEVISSGSVISNNSLNEKEKDTSICRI